MGPYEYRGNVNRDDNGEIIIKAQQNNVAPIPTRQGIEYVWSGQRWRSGPTPGWELGHSFQYWAPLRFYDDGSIARFEWLDEWDIDIPAATPR